MQLSDFSNILERDFSDALHGSAEIAVAVSGGPDSVALLYLMDAWAAERGVKVHALHVDHGLRKESADEAGRVRGRVMDAMPSVMFEILRWDAPKDVRVQEEARKARYALMAEYCRARGIGALFLAHHMDDQAETVLFRLAKGSGLDGLCGMRGVQDYDADVKVCRPLLGLEKADLVAVCEKAGLSFLSDPSNACDDYARVRLRQARDVLAREGLSAKRLSVTAKRLLRAREALEAVSVRAYDESALSLDTQRVEFDLSVLLTWPEDIVLRVVARAMGELVSGRDYAPRMERVEALVHDVMRSDAFRKRTLGGVVFERDDVTLSLYCEAGAGGSLS